jgi:hypothetical protein
VLVLESDFLDVGFRSASSAALDIQHAQQAGPLFLDEKTNKKMKKKEEN